MQTIKVPAKFANDHMNRCRGQAGKIESIEPKGRSVILTLDDEALANLVNDARYYADPFGPDEGNEFGLQASAKRLLAAIERQDA